MHVYEFRCPNCAARLRCRDRSWVGRRIQCPDCGGTVEVAAGNDGKLFGTLSEQEPQRSQVPREPATSAGGSVGTDPTTTSPSEGSTETSFPSLRPRRSLRERLLSPAGIGWIVAAGIGVLLLGLFVVGPEWNDDDAQLSDVARQNEADPDPNAEDAGITDPPDATLEDRMLVLHGWIDAYLEEHGTVPRSADSDLSPGERLSWQAVLVANQPDERNLQPLWDRRWDDQLNDRFVRRRIDTLLNPGINQPTGEQGYPATHFTGVAGVGADAAELPKLHGRAGIFGIDRDTTPDDISDGLANTMMVAGVGGRHSSWAAGGRGTVRGFVQEPYINGPDGFGTGHADGMYVLMADGSVRFLSDQTDPTIIRRMAAMSDGLSLDPDVPGEPGDSRSVADPQVADRNTDAEMSLPPDPFGDRGDSEAPIRVILAEDEPLFDVAGALEFPIAKFVQTQPVSLLDMLYQWEEMAGIPIDATPLNDDPAAIDRLEQDVTLDLSNTTLGEILAELLEQAGLRYDAGRNGVRLMFADPS